MMTAFDAVMRPPVKRRSRTFSAMKRFRFNWTKRLWNGAGRHKARGLRVWISARYPYEGRR